jgi:hypothetical protein
LNVGNARVGVLVSTNGSGAQILKNTIAFNGSGASGGQGAGVQIDSGSTSGNGNLVSQNAIFANVGIGIELGETGATGNQPVPTPGPNNSQNAPVITSANQSGGGTQIQGTLSSVPNHTFRIEFYANAARDPSTFSDILSVLPGQFSQGQTYIGSTTVTANGSGNASFATNLAALPGGEPFVTATATDITNSGSGPHNDTSEFSPVVPLGGPSFVVANTGDTGLGTLREAIFSADNTPGAHSITFAIPPTDPRHFFYANDGVAGQVSQGAVANTTAASDSAIGNIDPDWPHSWYSILPASPLPPLIDANSINGFSQPGTSRNTLAILQQGFNTVLKIEIDGQNITGDGLTVQPSPLNTTTAPGTSTIQGLAVNRFGGNGIVLSSFGGDLIAGNFVGTDVSGTVALGNGRTGVYVNGVDNFAIGDGSSGAANLISGNGGDGIYVYDTGIAGNVDGNLIGGDRNVGPLTNAGGGLDVVSDLSTSVSPAAIGSARGARPLARSGPLPMEAAADGLYYLPFAYIMDLQTSSKGYAITLAILLGFTRPEPHNLPKASSSLVPLATPSPGPAIQLLDGANPDTSQPVLTSATSAAGTTVSGTLHSQPNSTYVIQVYASKELLPPGYGPGEQYIGSVKVTTNAAGNGSYTFQSSTAVPLGQFITATATLLDASGNPLETSMFSAGIAVQPPRPQVVSVTKTKQLKRKVNLGTGTITIVFNEAMGTLAGSSSFYSLATPKTVRVHKKLTTKYVPVAFSARLSAANTVSLKLAKPSKRHVTLIIRGGDPAADGTTLGSDLTIVVQ